MEGAVTRTILEYLIIRLKSEEERQLKGLVLEGIVLVSIVLIAAAGNFCSKILSEQILKEMEGMLAELSVPWTRPQTAGGCSHEPLDSTPLQLAFKVHERPEVLMTDCLAIKQLMHKISMVHPKIRFHYCVNVSGAVSAETYCGAKRESMCVLNGIKLLTDQRHYIRVVDRLVSCGANLLCDKIHPVLGRTFRLLIPHKVAEIGFTGELEVTPAATLCPCLKLYPNQPAKIAAVSIFFYDPAGLPISFYAKGKTSLFFDDPSNLAEWDKYSYCATLDSDSGQEEGSTQTEQAILWQNLTQLTPALSCQFDSVASGKDREVTEDRVSPDVRYKLQQDGGNQEDDPDAWEQTLLLFLFLHYSDHFQDKPSYDFWARRMIASHMDQILLCSRQAVKHGAQAVIDAMLEEHCKREKNQQRLKLSLPVILDAISSVVSGSTNSRFRRACLQSLQVADTPELMAAIQTAFRNVTRKRLMPSGTCNITRLQSDDSQDAPFCKDGTSAYWSSETTRDSRRSSCSAGQKLSQEEVSDSLSSVDSEPASLLDRAGLWGEMRETKRRKTANMENDAGGAPEQETLAGSQERTDELMTDFGRQLSSCLWCPREGADVNTFLGERDEGFTAVSEDGARSSENLWQGDHLWLQEISNLSEWTS